MILSKHFKYDTGYHMVLLKFPDPKTFYTITLEKYQLTQENSYVYVMGVPTWIIHSKFMFSEECDKMLEIILNRTHVDRNKYHK